MEQKKRKENYTHPNTDTHTHFEHFWKRFPQKSNQERKRNESERERKGMRKRRRKKRNRNRNRNTHKFIVNPPSKLELCAIEFYLQKWLFGLEISQRDSTKSEHSACVFCYYLFIGVLCFVSIPTSPIGLLIVESAFFSVYCYCCCCCWTSSLWHIVFIVMYFSCANFFLWWVS